jgi:hypothetical protein
MKLSILLLAVVATLSIPMSTSHSPPSEPLGRIGSAIDLPKSTTICVDTGRLVYDNAWPIFEGISQWNLNELTKFTTDTEVENCTAVVIVTLGDVSGEFGHTELFIRNIFNVELNSTTPTNQRLSVICHEFGHVLGLHHSKGDGSCMDPGRNNPSPTQADLTTVASETFTARTPS